MNNIKRYNIFILLSTLSRNIPEVYSAVLLYKMDYSLKDILLFFTVLYLLGALTSVITIYILNKIKSKYILILSSIIFSLSFYYMSIMSKTTKSLLIFSIIYSIGSYTYHTLRHYYAIKALEDNKKENIGNILIFTNIAIILSSLIGGYIQSKLSTFALALFVVILSIVSFIPLFKFEASIGKEKIKYQKIEKNKLKFFILEQAKVINLSLQPLYLYLFVNSKITYVGIYNVILGISSCIFIYFFTRKVNDKKYFKYLNIIFCLFLLLKLNIYNKKEIVKTYTNDTYDLMFGTVEDFLDLINLDELKTGTDTEIIKLVGKACMKGMSTVKALLKDVFEDITDEELKNTKISEISAVLINIVKYSVGEISKGARGKN